MTRPEDIPEDVWRHAESVAAAYSNAVNDVWILNSCVRHLRARAEIARALMAAEQRGAERWIDVALGAAIHLEEWPADDDASQYAKALNIAETIVGMVSGATAIRKGGWE